MKVSLITVVYNAEETISDAVNSVISQTYPNLQYIVIDGKSTDQTLSILKSFGNSIGDLVSEIDAGMYDALNKGIKLAQGDVIGILNADDMLASPEVLEHIVAKFQETGAEGVYGDLNYVHRSEPNRIIRKWKSKQVIGNAMKTGWMPAHPTLYLRKELFDRFGHYSLNYGSAADYELMLRFIYKNQINVAYLPKLLVQMRVGGMSNQSLTHRWKAFVNDWRALKVNQVPYPALAIVLKKLTKLKQFL